MEIDSSSDISKVVESDVPPLLTLCLATLKEPFNAKIDLLHDSKDVHFVKIFY